MFGKGDGKDRLSGFANFGAFGHKAQPVKVHVRPAGDRDQGFTLKLVLGCVLLGSGQGKGAGWLEHASGILKYIFDRGADCIGIDDDKVIIAHLAFGRSVVLITQDMSLVPPVVSAALDLTLVIEPPTAKHVRRVINLVTGGAARGLADADLAGWTFEQIVATIRPGSTARECVNRLKRERAVPNVTANDGTPDLGILPLFGPAKNWADEALRELERQRSGEIALADIENVLLYGPPGTGKTLLAKSFAKTANLPFVATSMAAWFTESDGHLDGVLRQAEAFFQTLLDAAPCVGLMDEIEALPNRATMNPQHREWWSGLVTGILLSVTKITEAKRGVILIGATNYRDQVDTALLRPGRLGRHVLVRPAESEDEVALLLRFHVGTDLTADEISRAAAAAGIPTAAEVECWVKAARRSAGAAERALAIDDLLRHMSQGDERTPAELYECALHEAGHAVAAIAMRFDLRSVSIIARGQSGGVTRWTAGQLFQNLGHVEDRPGGRQGRGRRRDGRSGDGDRLAGCSRNRVWTARNAALSR